MRLRVAAIVLAALIVPAPLWAWGYEGHRIVTRGAIELTPGPMRAFLERQGGEVVAHSIDPDLWAEKRVMAPPWTHFIDLDLLDNAPFAHIPREYDAALAKYGAKTLEKAGTLPWEIARREELLSEALRAGKWDEAVREAAWISHYIADSTMPLHATKDYKGEAAGNVILKERSDHRNAHARIEVGLPDHFPKAYAAVRGNADNVRREDALGEAWMTLRESFALVPVVLRADREAAGVDPTFSRAFYDDLESRIGKPVRARLARAEELVASAWLTAWEDAGRPALPTARVSVVWPDVSAKNEEVGQWPLVAGAIVALLAAFGIVRRRRRRRIL